MSVISPQIVIENNWIKGLGKRDIMTPEGAGIDLRIGELFHISHGPSGFGQLYVEERSTPEMFIYRWKIDQEGRTVAELMPALQGYSNSCYTMQTIEKVELPDHVTAVVSPRSTLYRSGLLLLNGNVAPGYSGELTFGLVNFGPRAFTLEQKARVAHIIFLDVTGEVNAYQGQWQDGRLTQTELEEQV